MRHWITAFLVLVLIALLMHDLTHDTRASYSARATIAAIDVYRAGISPHLQGVIVCRFRPTCSAYGREVVRKYGFARGAYKAVVRISRCGPWTRPGTIDPP